MCRDEDLFNNIYIISVFVVVGSGDAEISKS